MPKRTTGKRLAAAKADGRRLAERLFEEPFKIEEWAVLIEQATMSGWTSATLDAAMAEK